MLKAVVARSANAARFVIVRSVDVARAVPRVARGVRDDVDHKLGRAVFGNTAGLSFNLSGRHHRSRMARLSPRPRSHSLTAELHAQGCVRAPGLISPERLAPVVAAYDRAIEDPAHSSSLTNPFFLERGVDAIRCVTDPAKSMQEVAGLLEGTITEVVTSYYGSPFICLLASPYRTYHVPPNLAAQKEPISNHWHCDGRRTDMLKVFILLRDTDESMGPLHVLSRPDTKTALHLGYRNRNELGPAAGFMEMNAKRLTGKAGDAMFCNTTLCFHRADIPAPGKFRDMIEMRFFAAVEGPGADWLDRMDLNAGA
jgi:hypothetical protein